MMRPPSTSNRRTAASKQSTSPHRVESAVPKTKGSVPASKQITGIYGKSATKASTQRSGLQKKSAINSDISEALAQVNKKVRFVEEKDLKVEAARKIQRYWREL